MNPVFPILARAAAFGAVIGLGFECVEEFQSKGKVFAIHVIACVALRAVSLFFGVGVAVSVVLGGLVYCMQADKSVPCSYSKLLGCMLLGGALGYVLTPASPGLNGVVLG